MAGGTSCTHPSSNGEVVRRVRLTSLPEDVLVRVLLYLPPGEVVDRLGRTCYSLYALAACDGLWQAMFCMHYDMILTQVFGDMCPPPLSRSISWRSHFFSFPSMWMLRAKAEGRVVFTIAGHVYDATGYVDDHPGGADFLRSASGSDATEVFQLAGHSTNARRILRDCARPELDAYRPCASDRSGGHGDGISDGGDAPVRDCMRCKADASSPLNRSISGRLQSGIGVLSVLLRCAQGRRKLLDCAISLVSAGVVDLERTGRDPVGRGFESSDAAGAKQDTDREGIQRLLPVQWHLACTELTSLSTVLRAPPAPTRTLLEMRGD